MTAHLSEDVSASLTSLSEHSLMDPKQCQNPDLRLGTCEELEHQEYRYTASVVC